MHAWACSVFSPSSSRLGSPSITALEPQFTAEASIRVDHDAEAHEDRLNRPLKKTCRCKVPPVHPLLHPSIDEENRTSTAMKGPPSDTPNLDDILARDFAELKVGEANIEIEEPPNDEAPADAPVTKPIAYNQRIDAVEDRASFAVQAPNTSTTTETNDDDEHEDSPTQEVLKAPTSTLGDDFDVEW